MRFVRTLACVSLLLIAALVAAAPAAAQSSHLCDLGSQTSVQRTIGSTVTVLLCWVPTVEVTDVNNPLGPKVVVPHRINGIRMQVDAGAIAELPLRLSEIGPSPVTGLLPYIFTIAEPVKAGPHVINAWGWSFVLDANGQPTAEKQDGNKRSITIVGVVPVQVGPPFAPRTGRIVGL